MDTKTETGMDAPASDGPELRDGTDQPSENKIISEEDKAVAALLSGMAKEPVNDDEMEGNKRSRRPRRQKKNHLYKDYETDFNDWDVEEVQEEYRARRSKMHKNKEQDVTHNEGAQMNQFGLLQQLLNGGRMPQHPVVPQPSRATIAKFIESYERLHSQVHAPPPYMNSGLHPSAFVGARQGNSAFFVPSQRSGVSPASFPAQMMQTIPRTHAPTAAEAQIARSNGIGEFMESFTRGQTGQPSQYGGSYEQQLLQFAAQGASRPTTQLDSTGQLQGLLEKLQQQSHSSPRATGAFAPFGARQESANPSQSSMAPLVQSIMSAMAEKAQQNGEAGNHAPFPGSPIANTEAQGQRAQGGENAYLSKFQSLLQSLGAFGDRR